MLSSSKLVAALFLVLLIGCKDNDLSIPSENYDQRIMRISADNSNFQEFVYENGTLTSYENVKNDTLIQSSTFYYDKYKNQNNYYKLLKMEEQLKSNSLLRIVYNYDQDNRIIGANYFMNGVNSGTLKYIYNSSNQIIKREQYANDNTTPWNWFEYDYDLTGDVKERRFFYSSKLSEKVIYRYDNKINPYSRLDKNLFYDITYSKNNIIEEITYSYVNGEKISKRIMNYTYDNNSHPLIREIESIVEGKSVKTTENYKYEYYR